MNNFEIDITKEISWNSKFETGVQRIDLEHKIFLGLLNSYLNALKMESEKDNLIRIINEIEKYAEFHFISEENFMCLINFPYYKNHQFAHFELLERLNISKHERHNSLNFLNFIYNWFVLHTINEDKRIGEFIIKNKIKVNSYYNFEITDKNGI